MARHPLVSAWLSARMALRSVTRVGRPCLGCEVRTSRGVGVITNGNSYGRDGKRLWTVGGEGMSEDSFDVVMSPGNLWHTATSTYAFWEKCWKEIDVRSVARGEGIASMRVVPEIWGAKSGTREA